MPHPYKIFDVDGTISSFVDNPADATVENDFVEYVVEAEKYAPGTHIILTGREDSRVYPASGSHTVDKILKPVLSQIDMTVISAHGLSCHTHEGKTYLHPVLEKVQPIVKDLHDALNIFQVENPGLFFEKKMTGITVNANLVKGEGQKKEILDKAKEYFEPYMQGSEDLMLADEHGSIEIRPVLGKKDGLAYFIEQGIVSPDPEAEYCFFCDSLGEKGTDRSLADDFVKNKRHVVQVLNNRPPYEGAKAAFANPAELSSALKNGFN